ncbi:6649_t:CDS:2, partial [Racocetra persica]
VVENEAGKKITTTITTTTCTKKLEDEKYYQIGDSDASFAPTKVYRDEIEVA